MSTSADETFTGVSGREPTRADVIVVGGGLAGLAAAATVEQAGCSAIVLEPRTPGGRARVTSRNSFVFNNGGHALYRGGAGMRVLRELGVKPQGSAPPLRRYKMMGADGHLHTMPSGPGSMLRTTALSPKSKAQLARLLGLLPRLQEQKYAGLSASEWLSEQGLRPDAEAVVRALVRLSSYADDLETFSAEAGIGQMKIGAGAGVLYLDGGWKQLIDGLAQQVKVRATKVNAIEPTAGKVEVRTESGETFVAQAAIIAVGTPQAAAALLPDDPGWADVGPPVLAACLDVGTRSVPSPGYVVGLDEPMYVTTQGPPAKNQAPDGGAMVSVIRYGVRSADQDRADLTRFLRVGGIAEDEEVEPRFLARMVVTGAAPLARNGGFAGRPGVTETGSSEVFIAGDWVGPDGVMTDASLASARAAGLASVRRLRRSATIVP